MDNLTNRLLYKNKCHAELHGEFDDVYAAGLNAYLGRWLCNVVSQSTYVTIYGTFKKKAI